MALLNFRSLTLLAFSLLALTGCQIGYLVTSASSQVEILLARRPIEEVLKDSSVSEEDKRKLRIAIEAKQYSQSALGLKKNKNYSSYVKLNRPYVSYVVSASPKNELKHYLWNFPMVGELPYKGFPSKEMAEEEADKLRAKNLDVHVRGVSAYSTLGWFNDPVLSSMLRYKDHDLVNTIIHENVHATMYFKSAADFNERLAAFVGNIGTEKFYLAREGEASSTLKTISLENQDEKMFSAFISAELDALKKWYLERAGKVISEDERTARFKEIQDHYFKELKPKLKTNIQKDFESRPLNNANLLQYELYMKDLADFDAVFSKLGRDFTKFIDYCRQLEHVSNPEQAIKAELKR